MDAQHRGFPYPRFLDGGGELGELIRQRDWSQTRLGPVERWPQALKTAVGIMLTSRQPMFVWWGDDLINLYNDAYKSIVGGKHPQALGQSASVVWREIWDQIESRAKTAMFENEGTYDEALLLIMERHGYSEETYYTFSYSPVPNDEGGAGGILCANTDDTQRIIGERQLALLRELATRTADARTIQDACSLGALSLETNPRDLPFALIYLLDSDHKRMVLAGAAGIAAGHSAAPQAVALDGPSPWPFSGVLESHAPVVIRELPAAESLPAGAWLRHPSRAVALPIAASGTTGHAGVLIAGLNPFRLYDDSYQRFLELVSGQIAAAIANAQAYEAERRRAESLLELDRAKTAFFSNVSHEFRTPLTLLLGPLEEILSHRDSAPAPTWNLIDVAHRNALRLLRLVNTLLDFSRIEAGRTQANYQPTDLCALTADVASSFRSIVEKAGLAFRVNCPPLAKSVYVDRDMWEKIVLNLISNAFKYTFQGQIEIEVKPSPDGSAALLVVRDTGTGIPLEELPHLFERFHRVEGAAGRTHEGTGIGLALVQELVRLHGGEVAVASEPGKGSSFTVALPFGTAHLPREQVGVPSGSSSTATRADVYVEEAERWLPLAGASNRERATPSTGRQRVLLADDNTDMRDYVRRLLESSYDVIAVGNGQEALTAAIEKQPDLVLSDIMMPGLDGFDLVNALRSRSETRAVPVILLSARAGDEARIEGLQSGADDYLVKPFTARELLARVDTHLRMAQLRQDVAQTMRAAEERHEQALASPAGARFQSEFRLLWPDGSTHYVLSKGKPLFEQAREGWRPVRVVGILMDLTDRKNSEESLREMQKLESLGLLAGGIAHDFNNLLTGIIGNASILEGEFLAESPQAEAARCLMEAADRMARLTGQMLAYSGRGRFIVEPVNLSVHVAQIVSLIHASIPKTVELRLALDNNLPNIEADASQLQQVIMNLVINAAEAIDGSHGVVEVRTGVHQVGDEELRANVSRQEVTPGQYVILTVSDTGHGMDPATQSRIFDPFFTTKFTGRGLGLAAVLGIVRGHKGLLTLDSRPGEGSTFRVFFPVMRAHYPASAPPDAALHSASGKVLVVDDEPLVRTTAKVALSRAGYSVVTANDGRQGVDLFASKGDTIDLVLLDMTMPVMSGEEAMKRLIELSPDVVILASSGYDEREAHERFGDQIAGFLQKPYTSSQLLGKVGQLLRKP